MTSGSVRIGEAAALYGLTPSTLRWWEKQGVLDPPVRHGGRRFYGDRELRRIGLAYLCCVTGGMRLEDAAVVASGAPGQETWRCTVRQQAARIEDQIDQLQAAHGYLRHLLQCTDDDIAECPYLDNELIARTPRGRAPDSDLVAAARIAADRAAADRDVTAVPSRPGDEIKRQTSCEYCAELVLQPSRGRPRKYCSHACQQRAYRLRRREGRDGEEESKPPLRRAG
ncbi:MerR family transcriptional regulator [Amycolatopsis sp. NPDC054798]